MADARILQVTCPLGNDVFVLDSFSGSEGLSQLFAFQLELASTNTSIAPADVVGKPMGFQLKTAGRGDRVFHGRVRQFVAGPIDGGGLRRYRAQVVPWFWFLTKRKGCRIFQKKKPTDIAEAIFGELGFSDYKVQVRGTLPTLEYCVQYRESDFDFLSRLFEEYGIFYWFEHSASAHTLILADAKTAFTDCSESKVKFSSDSLVENCVTRWNHGYEYTSGKRTTRDYDFTKSATQLESTVSTVVELPNISKYEVYDHPGQYVESSVGDAKMKAYMEAEEATFDVVNGESTCVTFKPSGKFSLSDHPVGAENKTWVILQIQHSASDPSAGGGGSGSVYHNSFECMLASKNFRPALRTPKPLVHGLQTAEVVGPSGEEIYTDEHGRIRVQFHWDREGQKNESSSCWIRVSQPWAGKSFGAFHLPRIGQEVVIAFLEGDPDRPLVVGSVYNDVQTPPFALPANKTQTGIRTRSSMSGGSDNCNEFRFEDKKGEEQLFLHAEKDELHEVENDQTLDVGHDQTITVGNDCSEDITHDRTLHVGNDHSDTIDKNRTISIGENHDETIGGDMSVKVQKSRTLTVSEDLAESIDGNMTVTVTKDRTTTIKGALKLDVTKDVSIGIQGQKTETVTKELSIHAKKLQLEADDEILIKTGSASILLKKSGDITIDGKKITIKGSGDVVLKGSKVTAN